MGPLAVGSHDYNLCCVTIEGGQNYSSLVCPTLHYQNFRPFIGEDITEGKIYWGHVLLSSPVFITLIAHQRVMYSLTKASIDRGSKYAGPHTTANAPILPLAVRPPPSWLSTNML
jgi:hypothetical protein